VPLESGRRAVPCGLGKPKRCHTQPKPAAAAAIMDGSARPPSGYVFERQRDGSAEDSFRRNLPRRADRFCWGSIRAGIAAARGRRGGAGAAFFGEVRIRGRYSVEISAACDRCLERTRYPLEGSFDLYYRPAETIAREEEVGIDEAEAEIGFTKAGGSSWKMFSASRFCWLCLCSESAGKIARAFARRAARTGIRVRAIVRWKMRRAAGRHSEIWRFPRDGTSLRAEPAPLVCTDRL